MQITADWLTALDAARRGELSAALDARAAEPEGALAAYFYGRCLAEAGVRLDESAEVLTAAREAAPGNVLIPQALALALARMADPAQRARAAALWNEIGLPHDLDLLGQAALTFELQLHEIPDPAAGPVRALPWPAALQRLAYPTSPWLDVALPPPDAETADNLTHEGATKSPEAAAVDSTEVAQDAGSAAPGQIEEYYHVFDYVNALRVANALIEAERDDVDVHLGAGLAAEEAGDLPRARAHLAHAVKLQHNQHYARTLLGRAHWRAGWTELAMALWRSVPVEGPYDYGRHYHLALAHASAHDRASAQVAMRRALEAYFYDTRHIFIERAWLRWRRVFAMHAQSVSA